ncbi:hypothetical protein ALP15_200145 [Pseudomonas savastanoi]|uniref:Uncharacterized protein n=3 Tax=Pseudomonas syringae group genomosp. 2 TaxID=251698 RepID=A0AAX1W0I2_PSEAJ|nr:hypothetical protein ALO60_200059 [Pseudomonas amygdali pv. tabaci]RML83520.1 hypothetical protein ALQ89_200046 [Pseudomonas amygdali pv. tabaci]RMV15832.1 hypothetical protein ALP15_200145 [Pseudomonas savastanoi]
MTSARSVSRTRSTSGFPKAVALIALSRRSYFENPKPPIEAFANQMSHLFQKPTLVANTMS